MLNLLTSTGIDDATADNCKVAKEEWFDATGRKVDAKAKGLLIKRSTLTNGAVLVEKTIFY